jgi:hypothetical protein
VIEKKFAFTNIKKVIAINIPGKERIISTILMINESMKPPIKPARSPRVAPIKTEDITTEIPINREQKTP